MCGDRPDGGHRLEVRAQLDAQFVAAALGGVELADPVPHDARFVVVNFLIPGGELRVGDGDHGELGHKLAVSEGRLESRRCERPSGRWA